MFHLSIKHPLKFVIKSNHSITDRIENKAFNECSKPQNVQ